MTDPLAASSLLAHVRALAQEIGPRPAGSPAEAQARAYIREVLQQHGLTEVEEMPLPAWDTWGYTVGVPALLGVLSGGLGRLGRWGKLGGALLSLFGAYHLQRSGRGEKQPLRALFPKRKTANLIVRLSPRGEVRRRVVLLGHTDTNKHRPTFAQERKRWLLPSLTAEEIALTVNGVAQLAEWIRPSRTARTVRRGAQWTLALALPYILNDERWGYVDGAADNASAVACLLGLGAQLQAEPLAHTEVWLAFTAAEEVGCLGVHALLDAYGDQLAEAWFLDFEMVSTSQIVYITRHSSLSYFGSYAPDAESLAWAQETARRRPDLGLRGQEMVIVEEVGSLRGRGFRGLCLAGVGEDGWLANWHRHTDDLAHLDPQGLERAARFAWEMLQVLDEGWTPGS